ncbi:MULTISPECIES: YuzD family protein [unclassified Virgibacillus]|uniref:YuzD family protein n=1 Tax=unclassified Virgibacillus TaxID=2620237 RepID=UPI0024DE5F6D|nr:YuzD family protein [Virgibacillus sp. LDC-1]
MISEKVRISVYGADQICASCVGAPGSKDTFEWLQAAIGRKYMTEGITYEYIDIDETPATDIQKQFIDQIEADELFYPLVLINDEIVAEGIPRLKDIYRVLDTYRIKQQNV